jgi:tetratricopeptide (TPR) repeat protein
MRTPLPLCAVLLSAATLIGCASSLDKARAARNARDDARAEQYLRKSMASDPEDRAAAQRELAGLKFEQAQAKAKQDPAAAEQLVRESLTYAPGDEKAVDLLGRVIAAQGRLDEAIGVLSGDGGQPCDMCKRYLSVLLLERAGKREAAKDWEGARADYSRATELVPDASSALAVARCSEQLEDHEGMTRAVEKAVPLIRPDDEAAQAEFRAFRERAVMAAAARGDVAMCDRWLNFFPPNAGGDGWYVLQLRVAQELYRQKQVDVAIGRARHILGPTHADTLPEARKTEFQRFLADIYRLRGVGFLREGKLVEADDNFRMAMDFAPSDDKIKLLRALAIAGNRDIPRAMQVVQALPKETKGHAEVLAILESMQVADRLADGDIEGAKAALARAQAASSETPEVHVAMAELLFVTPVPEISKGIVRQLKKSGIVKYPNDEVNRYGEALSELAWAREQARGLGEGYLFRGPGSDARIANLERQLRSFYPFPVEFNAESTAILRLRFKNGAAGEVGVKTSEGEQTVRVPAGSEGVEVVVREPGLTYFRISGKVSSFVTEPYTRVTIDL